MAMSQEEKERLLEKHQTKMYISGLTPTRKRLYLTLINPDNMPLSVSKICELAEVSRTTYYDLMKDREFSSKVKEFKADLVDANMGDILEATFQFAKKEKNHQDRKLLLMMHGYFVEKSETKVEGSLDIGHVSDVLNKYLREDEAGDSSGE